MKKCVCTNQRFTSSVVDQAVKKGFPSFGNRAASYWNTFGGEAEDEIWTLYIF